ncbi:MAG TPA: hypothetical protein VNN22_23100 [Verrucomicrobiae bacterium]|nr:hypothetical protein [Verrucomicrobiae bacterium]
MKALTSLIAVLLFAGLTARADVQRADSKESLRVLTGVYVICQLVDVQPEGLTTNRMETLVKFALAEAGVPVDAVPKKFNGDANLSITIATIKQTQLDVYVFTVTVEVAQDVQLTRDPKSKHLMSGTWRPDIQGITSPDRVDVIEQALKQMVNLFVKDYQAVNPAK